MSDWLSYATRDPISGVGWGSFDWEANPTWKLLLHSTEGGTYASARGSYSNNRFAPNVTVGPDPNRFQTVKTWQHLPFNSRSTTLADDPGGIRPNRDYVIQVEIVGYADLKSALRHGPSWLHVDSWPDWYKEGVAKVLNDILDAKPIPRRNGVRWVDYPASYGESADQRLSTSAFDAYAGILGHQHAPENSHGDPGDLGDFVNDYLLTEPEPPKDWFDMADEKMLIGACEKAIEAKRDRIVGAVLNHRFGTGVAKLDSKAGGGGRHIPWFLRDIRFKVDATLAAVELLAKNLDGVSDEVKAEIAKLAASVQDMADQCADPEEEEIPA